MCKKLVVVKYMGINPEGDYQCVDKDYGYFISTKKQIKEGDFICIGCITKDSRQDALNEDRKTVLQGL